MPGHLRAESLSRVTGESGGVASAPRTSNSLAEGGGRLGAALAGAHSPISHLWIPPALGALAVSGGREGESQGRVSRASAQTVASASEGVDASAARATPSQSHRPQ